MAGSAWDNALPSETNQKQKESQDPQRKERDQVRVGLTVQDWGGSALQDQCRQQRASH